jgi:transcriptional regulator with XRE-family HTH domain
LKSIYNFFVRQPVEIASKIQLVMSAKKLTVKDLAKKSGLKAATIYEWLRSESVPGSKSLTKLADGLEVTADYLLGFKDYGRADARAIVVRESLAVFLRDQRTPSGTEDNALYERIISLRSAPIDVAGWRDLSSELVPAILESFGSSGKKKRPKSRNTKSNVDTKKKAVVISFKPYGRYGSETPGKIKR